MAILGRLADETIGRGEQRAYAGKYGQRPQEGAQSHHQTHPDQQGAAGQSCGVVVLRQVPQSAQTKVDMTAVLAKVDILPRMNESLNVLNDTMYRIQNSIEGFIAKKTAQQQIALQKKNSVNRCEIHVTRGAFISEGGQAKVYAATYAGQPAALKEIPVKGSLKEVDRIMKNFKTEVHLITGFSHPNVFPSYGVITTEIGFLKIVMVFAPGGTLRELLDADPATPLSKKTQMDYVTQLCHGFIYLHAMNVAHMDFKSLNVLRSVAVVCANDMYECAHLCVRGRLNACKWSTYPKRLSMDSKERE